MQCRSTLFNVHLSFMQRPFLMCMKYPHVLTRSCSQCLQTDNACGWCIYNKVCSGTPAPCTNETNWFQVSCLCIHTCCSCMAVKTILFHTQLNGANTTYLDVCPLLEPSPSTPTGDYVQPVNIDRDIELQTRNLPAPVSLIINVCIVCTSFHSLPCRSVDSGISAV